MSRPDTPSILQREFLFLEGQVGGSVPTHDELAEPAC
jgi:hypothetical protein